MPGALRDVHIPFVRLGIVHGSISPDRPVRSAASFLPADTERLHDDVGLRPAGLEPEVALRGVGLSVAAADHEGVHGLRGALGGGALAHRQASALDANGSEIAV